MKALLTLMVALFAMSSCEDMMGDYLDKPQGSDVNEDTIFSTKKNIEKLLFAGYSYGLHSYYPYHNLNNKVNPNPMMCMTSPITDEGEMSNTWYSSEQWNIGAVLASSIESQEDGRWPLRFKAIRICNILIEKLPEATVISDREKAQYAAEAYFIRALNNFELFKRYGGMPIVDHRLLNDESWELPRASVEEFVDYIADDCDKAYQGLNGVEYPENQRGRITASAALALKTKVLLYAASPLFNTSKPYLATDHPELVCYGNEDANRWKKAADAAEAALDQCGMEGFYLLSDGDPENDYRKLWETYDNCEIILAEKWAGNQGNWSWPWCGFIPTGFGMSTWGEALNVTHNFIRKYEKMDGTPMQWNEPGVEGHDLMEKYAELDPRFRQTVAYNGSYWNNGFPDVQLYEGALTSPNANANETGALVHKLVPRELAASGGQYQMQPNGILFRVAELYLSYAEALNEYLSAPDQKVYEAVNIVRARAGMPGLPAGLSKEQMRERIKKERDIELSFEDHRLWDIRRWMDAEKEGVMQGTFYKVKINRISGSGLDQKCDYTILPFEQRVWHRKMYLHPIKENEVNKGYLLQNPGW